MATKSHSGGGRTPVKVGIRSGPPSTKVIHPAGAAHIGRSVGNHADNKSVAAPKQPLMQGTRSQVPLGNALAGNVGRGGPGAGRTVSPSGAQGTHGPTNPGGPSLTPTPGGGPAGFGFTGKKG